MPLLSVEELLVDPDFCEQITVIRMMQRVDDHGRAVVYERKWPIIAVVTQASGDTLGRPPEGSTNSGTITVHTQERLIVEDGVADADEIIWLGRRYIVSSRSDWSQFGGGFTMATCTLKPISP